MNITPIDDKPLELLEIPESEIHVSKREWLNFSIILFLVTSIAVVNYKYEVQNETPTKVGLVAAFIIMCLLLCIALSNYAVRARLPTKTDLINWLWVIIALPYAAFIFSYFLFHIYAIYTKTKTIPFSTKPVYTILFAITIICLGLLFFAFRLRQRFWYGFFEAIVGVYIATLKFYSDVLLMRISVNVPTHSGLSCPLAHEMVLRG